MKKAWIEGVPFWYDPERDEYEPRYFWSDLVLSIIMNIKVPIYNILGKEIYFKIKVEE